MTTDSVPPSSHSEAPPADAPVSDRYRSLAPSEPAEIRRKLLFGVALVLAMISVYAGLLAWGRLLQYGLAGLAVLTVFAALVSGVVARPQPPTPPAQPDPPETRA